MNASDALTAPRALWQPGKEGGALEGTPADEGYIKSDK